MSTKRENENGNKNVLKALKGEKKFRVVSSSHYSYKNFIARCAPDELREILV
jgi:hypothetical protein